jgi:hypothetical protein
MDRKIEKVFSWFILLLFIFIFFMTWQYGARARLVPLILLIPVIILAGIHLWRIHYRPDLIKEEEVAEEGGESFEINAPFDQEMTMIAWFAAFAAAIWLTGFLVATPLFLITYLRLWAKERWLLTLVISGISTLCMYLIVEMGFNIILYRGWLFSFWE